MRLECLTLILALAACSGPADNACTTAVHCDDGESCVDGICVRRSDGGPFDAGPLDAGPCVPDCTDRLCGPDPVCGTSCGECAQPGYCNEQIGQCVELDAVCPELGAPMAAYDERALGIATNELTWPAAINIDREIAFDDVQRIGAHYIQLVAMWSTVEPSEGAFDWASTDALLEEASSRGLTPIVIVGGYPPVWALDTAVPPERVRLDAFREYVRAVVLRYGAMGMRITNEFQFDNEPNHLVDGPTVLYGTREAYLELLSAMAAVVHETDPAARVWGPALGIHARQDGMPYDGWSSDPTIDWVPTVDASIPMQWLDAALATNAIDVVSVHLYYHVMQRMVDVFRRVVARVSGYRNGHVPIVVNEFNTDGYCLADDDENAHAAFASSYYTCLFAAGADSALYFNATDFRITPPIPNTCETDTFYPLGLRSYDGHARSVLHALDHLNEQIAAQRTATARIEGLPAECILASGVDTCTTSLVVARRSEARAIVVRRDSTGEAVGCLPAGEVSTTVSVAVTAARERFTLHAADGCASAPDAASLDAAFVRGTTAARVPRQGAILQLDGPCTYAEGADRCATTMAWWSEGVTTYPKVQIRMGAALWQCSDANTVAMFRTSEVDPWIHDQRFRLYEASDCTDSATLGRLLAATRAQGR